MEGWSLWLQKTKRIWVLLAKYGGYVLYKQQILLVHIRSVQQKFAPTTKI